MKKGLIIGLISLLVLGGIAFSVYTFGFKSNKNKEISEWTILKFDDYKIMSVVVDYHWFSDIKKAYLTRKLKEGNLPISFSVSMSNSKKRECKSIRCKIAYKDFCLEAPLENLTKKEYGLNNVYSGTFSCNLAEIKEKSNDELISILSNLTVKDAKIYVSFKEEDEDDEKEDWVALN